MNNGAAELVRRFANTIDVEDGTDELGDLGRFTGWLRAEGLIGPDAAADAQDLDLARALRGALRDTLVAHHEGADEPDALRRLDGLAARMPLRVSFAAGARPSLAPTGDGGRAALGRVMAAIVEAGAGGSWERLKICPADDCRWTFYDQSKNQSRRWCGAGCRNVEKTRAYRARRRAPQAEG